MYVFEVDGRVVYNKELKGLDLVRRDWCPLSKDTGRFVVDEILSGKPRDEIVQVIHSHLNGIATEVRAGRIDLKHFVVTKVISSILISNFFGGPVLYSHYFSDETGTFFSILISKFVAGPVLLSHF